MKTIVAETAAHIPLCAIDDPKSVLILGVAVEKILLDECAKHGVAVTICSLREADFDIDEGVVWKSGSIAINAESLEGKFDAIIDLRTQKPNADEARTLLGKLTEGGVLLKAFGALEREQMSVYRSRRFVIPCALSAFAPLDGGINGYIFVSQRAHPTANLNIQRADTLDCLSYYSADAHNAAFALPPYILAQFDDLIKN
jgi:spermidine synthase